MTTTKRVKRRRISKIERFFYKTCTFISIMLVIGIVFGQATLSKVNLELEILKKDINKKEESNQSLVMKINEMASLENIQTVASSQGLSYNKDNIKVISGIEGE